MVEALAVLKAMRPRLKSGCVGSCSVMDVLVLGAVRQ